MIDKKQLISELIECVKDATDIDTQVTGLTMCALLMNEVIDQALNIPVVSTRTFVENQEVTYKGEKYFFKEYNPKNGKTLIANAKSVRYHDYNDWWVNSAYVC